MCYQAGAWELEGSSYTLPLIRTLRLRSVNLGFTAQSPVI